jgi:adenosylcobinamide-GDP ribazoletransferase
VRAALQFLTILPIPAPHVPPGAAAIWYPAVGALLGLLAAAAWHSPFGATLSILVAVFSTGGLHEDGLADICDAVRAGRTRERMFEVLKDSRIGAYGATAIVLSILVRWQAMAKLAPPGLWWKFALAFAASRAAIVVLAATTPAAAPGLGEAFRTSLPRYAAPLVTLQIAVLAPWQALVAATVSIVLVRAWLMARLGGITGDCLGFQCQITEAAVLMALAW